MSVNLGISSESSTYKRLLMAHFDQEKQRFEKPAIILSGEGALAKGTVVAPQLSGGKYVDLGAITAVTNEDVGKCPDGSQMNVKGNCNNKPVLPGSVTITEVFTGKTFTDASLRGVLKGDTALGVIDYNNADWLLMFESARSISDWAADTAYSEGAFVKPTTPNNLCYEATTAGTSHASTEPTWPTTPGETVTDGTAVWTCRECYKVAYKHFGNAGAVDINKLGIINEDGLDATSADVDCQILEAGIVNYEELTPTIDWTDELQVEFFKQSGFGFKLEKEVS